MAIFTLYMYSIRKVIMYNCHLDTQHGDLGPFKGCFDVSSLFLLRGEKDLSVDVTE